MNENKNFASEDSLGRKKANLGAFSHLEIPMQKKSVERLCRIYGVDISGLTIKIHRDAELLRLDLAGAASYKNIGVIDLFPNAFENIEELLKTVIHEGAHVKQYRKYRVEYVQNNRSEMERVARRYENFFYNLNMSGRDKR